MPQHYSNPTCSYCGTRHAAGDVEECRDILRGELIRLAEYCFQFGWSRNVLVQQQRIHDACTLAKELLVILSPESLGEVK